MTIKAFNSIQGYSVGQNPQQDIILANGDITTVNFTANGISNLGDIGNVKITGGSSGQSIVTDGNGNLTFSATGSNNAAPMPYYIPIGESYSVPNNFQGLFAQPIDIEGDLVIDGMLIEVSVAFNANSNQILFDGGGDPTGNVGFTFESTSGNMAVPGNVLISGNLEPSSNNTFSIGNTTNRFTNIWLSGNTIYLGNSIITEVSGNLLLINPAGAQIAVTGNTTSSDLNLTGNVVANSIIANGNSTFGNLTVTGALSAGDITVSSIANGTSNVDIVGVSGNVTTSVAGNANIVVVTGTGSNVNGYLSVSGNVTSLNANLGNLASANYLVSNSGCVAISNGIIGVSGTSAGIFASTITDINLGLAANIVMGSTTGNITARNNLNAELVSANSVVAGDFYSKRPNIAVTTNTLIDSFGITEYRSAKYTIKVGDDTGYQALEVLLVHNDINSIITIYGSLSMTGVDLIALSTTINGSNVELRATGINANTSVNLLGTYVPD